MRLLATSLLLCASLAAQDSAWNSKPSAWQTLQSAERPQVETFATDYKQYLDTARSPLASTRYWVERARQAGFAEFTSPSQVKPGARLYYNNRDRGILLFVIGSEPLTTGSRIVAAHHDSPHLDVKARPFVNRSGIALIKTMHYGGIKNYQWSNLPLALVGRIDTVEGKSIDVSIGLAPGDPVFVIPDNAPHSDRPLHTRTYDNVLTGEELNPVAASIASDKGGVVAQALQALTARYGVKEEDLVSSELLLVPATHPADVGLDKGLIGAYGQDDRVSSYCAARSLLDMKGTPKLTAAAYLTNFEETGSGNTTGAQSELFFTVFERLVLAQNPKASTDVDLRTALHNSLLVSADANDGINPIFGEQTSEASNAARVGYGPAIKIYGGQFDAPSEVTAQIRGILDRNHIPWQTQTPRVDVGGGGTIGGFFSRRDMNVVDLGVPLLSMHSPYEMSSKADVWYFYRFMSAFLSQQ